jgi:NodT family efflux transporter outer membrane factor (OMF) lipoprotein
LLTGVASCANFATISGAAGEFLLVGPFMPVVPIATNESVLRLLPSIPLLPATMKHTDFWAHRVKQFALGVAALSALALSGCTSLRDYVHNGFKVGPDYHRPPALVAEHWIDAADQRLRNENDNLCTWWQVMNDPVLNQMMIDAYQQNLTLREAGWRVLQARAQLGIAVGNFFPQRQDLTGSYQRIGAGQNFRSQWSYGFNLAWELDFWGRFRRAIQSAEDTLDASVFNYDDVLVTLLGDIADNYVQVRTNQERIRLLENTVRIQTDVYNFINERLKAGVRGVTDLDRAQAESDLKQSQAQLANLRIAVRLAENRLCTLMGIPTVNLEPLLKSATNTGIPTVPKYLVVGMPADLLRRRPDVRRAEREAAAQAELIGIAQTDLYPAFTINGTIGGQAQRFSDLFRPDAFRGNIGPSFRWNLLNYGRIVNNVRFQDAGFQALVAVYQNTVLLANEEVENGIVTFLEAQDRAQLLEESVAAANQALAVIVGQYEAGLGGGLGDFNRYALITQTLIQQQDQWAQARGQVDQGLIQVYRALGGGWQIRLHPNVDALRLLPPVEDAPKLLPEQIAPPPAGGNLPPPADGNLPGADQPLLQGPDQGAAVVPPEKVVPVSAVGSQGAAVSQAAGTPQSTSPAGAPGTTPAATPSAGSTADSKPAVAPPQAPQTLPASSGAGAIPATIVTPVPAAAAAVPGISPQAPANWRPTAPVPASSATPGTAPQSPVNMLRPIPLSIVNPLPVAVQSQDPTAGRVQPIVLLPSVETAGAQFSVPLGGPAK